MARQPIDRFRVRCGAKIWTPWLPSLTEAYRRAHRLGLGRVDYKLGRRFLPGPLTWIEWGQQPYAGRRIVPVRAGPNGQPLHDIHCPPRPIPG